MALPTVSGEFGIVSDPEIKFSDKGNAWAKIRCVAKDRVRDANGTWADGDPLFIDIIVNAGAENLVESVQKGDSLIVTGRLRQRNWEKDGQKQSTMQIAADTIGVSVRWRPAMVARDGNTTISAKQAVMDALGAQEIKAPF